jgi:hypothetical protein
MKNNSRIYFSVHVLLQLFLRQEKLSRKMFLICRAYFFLPASRQGRQVCGYKYSDNLMIPRCAGQAVTAAQKLKDILGF